MTQFIVEWADEDPESVTRVWTWDDWLKISIGKRNWNSALVEARDELDAYLKAKRGETIY